MIEPFAAGAGARTSTARRSSPTAPPATATTCAAPANSRSSPTSTRPSSIPKQFDAKSFVDVTADVCIIPPNSFALARTVEYFRIPRNVLVQLGQIRAYARCLSAATHALRWWMARLATLEQMARRHEQGELFSGYSIGAHGHLIVTLLDQPRFIGRDSLYRDYAGNARPIQAPLPDHNFLKR